MIQDHYWAPCEPGNLPSIHWSQKEEGTSKSFLCHVTSGRDAEIQMFLYVFLISLSQFHIRLIVN